jgi:phosphotriesterase-related protein
MAIITVRGPIDGSDLGPTLPHEHIFVDFSGDYREPPPHIRSLTRQLGVDLEAPITLMSLGFLWREPMWSVSNQILDSYEDARAELEVARHAGIRAVVEPTAIGVGRMPRALRRLSEELDMHIVAGTGYYRQAFHPPGVAEMSVGQLEERMLHELTQGMDDTDVRAGLMGELGTTGSAILPAEERVLIAAGRVQRQTNALAMVHTEGRRDAVLEAIRILTANGADPGKVHICHVNEAPWWRDVVDRGGTVGLDCFGSTFSVDSEVVMCPTDQTRIDHLKAIFDAGHGDRVLASNDVCMKMRLHRYGGWGYDHIQTNLAPHMRRAGFTDADIDLLFVQNPRRLLDGGE